MQTLRTELFGASLVITVDTETPDDRGPMTVEPAEFQRTVEAVCDGSSDGRGIPMEPGSYSAFGVAGALVESGLTVEGAETPLDDADGVDELLMMDSAPAEVARHFELLARLR